MKTVESRQHLSEVTNRLQYYEIVNRICHELGAPVHHIGIDFSSRAVLLYHAENKGYYAYDHVFEFRGFDINDMEAFKECVYHAVLKQYKHRPLMTRTEWNQMTADAQFEHMKTLELKISGGVINSENR